MGAGHASAVQRRVEEHIFRLAAEKLHFELKRRVWTEARAPLLDGARIDVDGSATDLEGLLVLGLAEYLA